MRDIIAAMRLLYHSRVSVSIFFFAPSVPAIRQKNSPLFQTGGCFFYVPCFLRSAYSIFAPQLEQNAPVATSAPQFGQMRWVAA